MTGEEELLAKRLIELEKKSAFGGYYTFSDFLGLGEQSVFHEAKSSFTSLAFTLFGGAPETERKMIRFGNPEDFGYDEDFPISVIKIEPKSQKFADKLTHRDFLGAILNLGIERKLIGDIAIIDNVGYVFAKSDITDYIVSSLTTVKRTAVNAKIENALPDGELFRTERVKIQVSSERLDSVIAKVYSLSREDAQSLFKKRLVFVSGKLIESVSYTPKSRDVISVRGFGRFIYIGVCGTSKKGKLNVDVDVYV